MGRRKLWLAIATMLFLVMVGGAAWWSLGAKALSPDEKLLIGKWRQQTGGPGPASEMEFLPDHTVKGHTWNAPTKYFTDWQCCWYVSENRLVFERTRLDKTMRSVGIPAPELRDCTLVSEGADRFTLFNKIPQYPARKTPQFLTETWIRISDTD